MAGLAARRASPPPVFPFGDAVSLGPVVMADDPCEAAFAGADPAGARKYYRARYYDPRIGRFISEEPLRFEGGVNLYIYAGNRPAVLVDPDGLKVTYHGFGGAELKIVKDIYDRLKTTRRGGQLCRSAENNRKRDFRITKGSPPRFTAGGPLDTIYFDPYFTTPIQTEVGAMNADPESVLAHELGHAVTGTCDCGPGQMDNINQNENPVRIERGLPRRTAYPAPVVP